MLALLSWAPGAAATWSIAAVDPATRQVGVAGASCVFGAHVIAQPVPGVGVSVAQALSNVSARVEMAQLLQLGLTPREAVEHVANAESDSWLALPTFQLRQYGAVAFDAEPAFFTGRWTLGWAGARAGEGVTVQGNALWGPEVVDETFQAYGAHPERCLAERLMDALEAGALAGGDRRCAKPLSALSAFLFVAAPVRHSLALVEENGEAPTGLWTELWRNLVEPEPGEAEDNPVLRLRRDFERSRASPGYGALCPVR